MLPAALLALVLQTREFRVTIPVDPPGVPVAVVKHRRRLLVVSTPYVELSWQPSDDMKNPPQAGASYRVYKSTGSGAFAVLSSGVETLTLTDKAVRKHQAYRYYVTALIGQVESPPTAIVQVTP